MPLAHATAFLALVEAAEVRPVTAEPAACAVEETAFWALASAFAICGELNAEASGLEDAPELPMPSMEEIGSVAPEPVRSLIPSCCARRSGKAVPLVVVGDGRAGVLDRLAALVGLDPPSEFVIAVRRAAALSAGFGIGPIIARGDPLLQEADTLFLGHLADGAGARPDSPP